MRFLLNLLKILYFTINLSLKKELHAHTNDVLFLKK